MNISINKYSLVYILKITFVFLIFFIITCSFNFWAALLTIPYGIIILFLSKLFIQQDVIIFKNLLVSPSSGDVSNIENNILINRIASRDLINSSEYLSEIFAKNDEVKFFLYEIESSIFDNYLHNAPCELFVVKISNNMIIMSINETQTLILEFISFVQVKIIVQENSVLYPGNLIAIMPFGGKVKIYTTIPFIIAEGNYLYSKHTLLNYLS